MRKLQIPISWASWDPSQGTEQPWKWEDFLSEAELTAIQEYDSDLDKLCKPDTQESAQEKLEKQPIYLNANFLYGDKKGQPMFPLLKEPEVMAQIQEAYKDSPYLIMGEVEVSEAPPKEETKKVTVSLHNKPAQPIRQQEEVSEAEVIEEIPAVKPAVVSQPKMSLKAALTKKPEAQTTQPAQTATGVFKAPVKKVWPGGAK